MLENGRDELWFAGQCTVYRTFPLVYRLLLAFLLTVCKSWIRSFNPTLCHFLTFTTVTINARV